MPVLCVSDNSQDTLVVADLQSMSLVHNVKVGRAPYPADLIAPNLVLVSTREDSSVTPVDINAGKALPPVPLSHKPRSTTKHSAKPLALIGGSDKASTTVIDTGRLQVLFTVGSGDSDPRRDFGGGLACGHPAWCHDDAILHLDRIARRIELYDFGTQNLVASVNLPTSAHHVQYIDGFFFMMCEGNRQSLVPPSVIKYQISNHDIRIIAHQFLPIPLLSYPSTGGHHLTVDPSSGHVFVGTADARLFTLRMSDLTVLNGRID